MHGLVHRGLASFVTHTFGESRWVELCRLSGQPIEFDTLSVFDDEITTKLLFAAAKMFERPKKEFLEDFGTYLVTSPQTQGLRRLIRFGGSGFLEFLDSVEDLPGRVRLAVIDLQLPELTLVEMKNQSYLIEIGPQMPGFAYVMVGALRSIADDYGVLADISHRVITDSRDVVIVKIHDLNFNTGRAFDLVGVA